jgi:hypothetical protein
VTVEVGQLRRWKGHLEGETESPLFLVVSILDGNGWLKRKMWPEYSMMVGWLGGSGTVEYDGLEWMAEHSEFIEDESNENNRRQYAQEST